MKTSAVRLLSWISFALLAALAAPACSTENGAARSCQSTSECTGGRRCIDGQCRLPSDAGSVADTGAPVDGSAASDDTGLGSPDAFAGADTGPVPMDEDAGGWSPTDDSDGDTISDGQEGRATMEDTDADGVPDYLDDDSDLDGIPDAIEAGDADRFTSPIDSDADGTPDYRDIDSDANGIRDMIEGSGDLDGDRRPDFRDDDDDDDNANDAVEIDGHPSAPPDSDSDGTPDYLDVDSDGDTIRDVEERRIDTDADTIVDALDLDTDADGWTDAQEAGDADLLTAAIDTDGDTIADFRDPDSDDDGLSDAAERTAGTSRTGVDTDGDGVSDLIEVGAGTDPLSAADSPRTRGDFVFLVPYTMPPSPTRDTLQFSTTLQRADVYFLMDNTGSMGGTVAALQSGLTSGTLVAGCSGGVIGAIRCGIPEAWFGVGGFDDYPIGTYGNLNFTVDAIGIRHDRAFFQYATMTMDVPTAQTAVGRYRVNGGNDGPESGLAALYAVASRDTLGGYASYATGASVSTTPPACPSGFRGAACFRPDAVPILIIMSDVDQHNSATCGCNYTTTVPGGGPSYAATLGALATLNARVVGIDTGASGNFMRRLVQDTTIARGAPGVAADYVIAAPSGSGLTSSIVTLVQRASQVPLDVTASAVDIADSGESIDAVAAFLDHLETNSTGAPGRTCTAGFVVVDRAGVDSDSYPDTFQDVSPGSPVCFDVVPKMNDTVMPTLVPQLFRARINVVGDGFTPLDSRVIYFLVPPRIPDPNGG